MKHVAALGLLTLVACKQPEGRDAYLRASQVNGDSIRARMSGDYAKAADLLVASARLSRPEDLKERWYNVACNRALANQPDPAFEALEKGIQAGFLDLDNFDRDPDFVSLRSDPRLAPLRAQLLKNFNAAFPEVNQSLRHRILHLHREYAAMQSTLARPNAAPDVRQRLEALAASSVEALKKNVAEHGWPGRELVGEDGASAAINILSDSRDLAFQREMLPTVLAGARGGDVPGIRVALLVDRVAMADGKRQVYGTSWKRVGGRPVVDPIEDPDGVDARRQALGLRPLAEHMALFDLDRTR